MEMGDFLFEELTKAQKFFFEAVEAEVKKWLKKGYLLDELEVYFLPCGQRVVMGGRKNSWIIKQQFKVRLKEHRICAPKAKPYGRL